VGSICESDVFKKLLEVVLTFGNFLNQGSFRGNAQGVKINFLGELVLYIACHMRYIKNQRLKTTGMAFSCGCPEPVLVNWDRFSQLTMDGQHNTTRNAVVSARIR
jgi:hypothetical protein